MAELSVKKEFTAVSGSKTKTEKIFTVRITISGQLIWGFVDNCDSKQIEYELDSILKDIQGRYLDEIVGRATLENIAMYLFQKLKKNIFKIEVYEAESSISLTAEDCNNVNYEEYLLLQKAIHYFLVEDFDTAKNLLNRIIEMNKANKYAYYLFGRVLRYEKNYKAAIPYFKKVIELSPNSSEGYRNMGNMLLFLNDFSNMIYYFDKAIELSPTNSIALNNRGYAFLLQGKYEKAIADCSKAIELNPTYFEAYIDLANAYEGLGYIAESKRITELSKSIHEHLTNKVYISAEEI